MHGIRGIEPDWLTSARRRYDSYQRPANAYGMTSDRELCLLETYAREGYTGRGRIVDLGCWFGATSMALARGLAMNRFEVRHAQVEALDLFRWEEWMAIHSGPDWTLPRHEVGESFFESVRTLLEPYSPYVSVSVANLAEDQPAPGAIEFLFIDAMKNWLLANRITRDYFPLLMGDGAYVIQQDYAYHFPEMATNHLVMWFLRRHFEWLHHVPGSCSVAFACTTPIVLSELPDFTPALFTLDMVAQAYDYSLRCVSADATIRLQVCRLSYHVEQGHASALEAAMHAVDRQASELDLHMLDSVRGVLEKAVAGSALDGDAAAAVRSWLSFRTDHLTR